MRPRIGFWLPITNDIFVFACGNAQYLYYTRPSCASWDLLWSTPRPSWVVRAYLLFLKLLVPFFVEKPVPKIEIYLRFIGSLTQQCIGRWNFSHTSRGGGERSLASFAYRLLLRVFDVSSALLFFAFETKSQVQHSLQDYFHFVLIISKSNWSKHSHQLRSIEINIPSCNSQPKPLLPFWRFPPLLHKDKILQDTGLVRIFPPL